MGGKRVIDLKGEVSWEVVKKTWKLGEGIFLESWKEGNIPGAYQRGRKILL